MLLTPKISDHSIITVDLKERGTSFSGFKRVRNFKNFNETDFQLQLLSEEWDADCTDVNTIANNLTSQIIKVLDIHAPCKTITINPKWPKKGWWNEEIKEQMKERDILYKKATITGEVEHWNMYKRQKNLVVSLIRQHKTKYYEEKIDDCKGDPVSMWKTIKEIIKNKNDTYSSEIIFGEETVSDMQLICEAFNKYFLDSIEDLSKGIVKTWGDNTILETVTSINKTWDTFLPVHISILRKHIQEMPNKNSNIDGITTKILKLAWEVIGNRILHVINTSLEKGVVPGKWKKSTIVPVEKK